MNHNNNNAALTPTGLRCEDIVRPLGLHTASPKLSWQLPLLRRGVKQQAWQVIAATAPELLTEPTADMWNSGRVESAQSVAVAYAGHALSSRQRVYWAVRVWDEFGQASDFSAPDWWEMGQLDTTDWQAKWIASPTTDTGDNSPHPAPLLRHQFSLPSEVQTARVYISGIGYHELYINGNRVGDQVLAPSFSRYDKRTLYLVHDVTELLQPGENVLAVMLGNGWYNCHISDVWNFAQAPWRDRPKLLLQLHVTNADGTAEIINSDAKWKVSEDGPVIFDGLRNGETYDARREISAWQDAGFDDSGWKSAMVVPGPGGILYAELLPCRVMAEITPKSISEVRPGIFVIDIGQNITGWVSLRVSGEAGQQVTMRYAEKLTDDGDIDQSNIEMFVQSGDFQTDRYILNGMGEEVWHPRFTFHGFQYVQLSGFPGIPDLDTLRGCVVHTGFASSGDFSCANPLLNSLQKNTRWSYIGNFVGIPSDCPHREKNGWTGDALVATETGLYNYDATPAYRKWLRDIADEQRPNGQLPGIVPTGGWGYNWGSGPAWDSAFLQIPWQIYCYRGDISALAEHYQGMKRYLDFMTSMADGNILSFGLGDWCPPNQIEGYGYASPVALTSTGYYYANSNMLAQCARLLGQFDDAEKFALLADNIKISINNEFYHPESGCYAGGDQTSQGCALYWGLAAEEEIPKVLSQLVTAIEEQDFHLTFGILGAKYVLNSLLQHDCAETAYELVTQRTFPSWGHWIEQGATTLWESWEGTTSRNHIMFGDISAWFYKALAGIMPDSNSPGFHHSILNPQLVTGLDWAQGEHHSPYGLLKCGWQRKGEHITVKATIPGNSTADILLPTGDITEVKEGALPLSLAAGITDLGVDKGKVKLLLGAGEYCFEIG